MNFDIGAMYLGYALIWMFLLAILIFVVLMVIHLFPFTFKIKRDLQGRICTANTGQNINLLAGLNSRRKPRWFFGFMLLGPIDEPPRWPVVLTKKGDL